MEIKWTSVTRNENGVATMDKTCEIQMKTHGRKFESSHRDQIFTANETPNIVGKLMVELANLNSWSTVLEPSAGEGKLASIIRETTKHITCVELNSNNYEKLKRIGFEVIRGDFLKFKSKIQFDAVLMCPPKNSIPHVEHALKFLKSTGKLIALIREDSNGLDKYRNFYLPLNLNFEMNGEKVPSGLLIMKKGK